MNTERDRYLTEAMGECWHEWKEGGQLFPYSPVFINDPCIHCGEQHSGGKNTDLSSWAGFGKLFEWAQKQEWWCDIAVNLICFSGLSKLVHPDRFATAVYDYLKSRDNQ